MGGVTVWRHLETYLAERCAHAILGGKQVGTYYTNTNASFMSPFITLSYKEVALSVDVGRHTSHAGRSTLADTPSDTHT